MIETNNNYVRFADKRNDLDKEFKDQQAKDEKAKKLSFLEGKTKEELVKLCLDLWLEVPYQFIEWEINRSIHPTAMPYPYKDFITC